MPAKQAFPQRKSDHVFGQSRSRSKMFRAGLYARVLDARSADAIVAGPRYADHSARRRWTIAIEILKEVGSGASVRETPSKAVPSAQLVRSDLAMANSLYSSPDAHRQGL